MATAIIYGYVSADRQVLAGSGNFTVGLKEQDGVYNITFKDGTFNNIPAVTGTVYRDSYTYLEGLQVSQISEEQVQIVVIETDNKERSDRAFFFTAIGTAGD